MHTNRQKQVICVSSPEYFFIPLLCHFVTGNKPNDMYCSCSCWWEASLSLSVLCLWHRNQSSGQARRTYKCGGLLKKRSFKQIYFYTMSWQTRFWVFLVKTQPWKVQHRQQWAYYPPWMTQFSARISNISSGICCHASWVSKCNTETKTLIPALSCSMLWLQDIYTDLPLICHKLTTVLV